MRNRASEVWSFGPSRNDGVSDCFASARNCECCEAAESKIAAVLLRSNELLRSNSIHTPDVIARFPPALAIVNVAKLRKAKSPPCSSDRRSYFVQIAFILQMPSLDSHQPSMARKPATNLETGNAQASCHRIDVDRANCARHQRNGLRQRSPPWSHAVAESHGDDCCPGCGKSRRRGTSS